MQRERPAAYMQFCRSPHLFGDRGRAAGRLPGWARGWSSGRASACRCWRSSRTRSRPRRPASTRGAGSSRPSRCRARSPAPPAGFYAVILLVVTPASVFGMLTSAQALIVALFGGVGTIWGAGDRRRRPDPAERDPACRARQRASRASRASCSASPSSSSSCSRPEGIYWRVRDRLVRSARACPSRAPCRRPRRRHCRSGRARSLQPGRRRAAIGRDHPGGPRASQILRRAQGRAGCELHRRAPARSSASSGRTAPARPRCSIC